VSTARASTVCLTRAATCGSGTRCGSVSILLFAADRSPTPTRTTGMRSPIGGRDAQINPPLPFRRGFAPLTEPNHHVLARYSEPNPLITRNGPAEERHRDNGRRKAVSGRARAAEQCLCLSTGRASRDHPRIATHCRVPPSNAIGRGVVPRPWPLARGPVEFEAGGLKWRALHSVRASERGREETGNGRRVITPVSASSPMRNWPSGGYWTERKSRLWRASNASTTCRFLPR
jgi:hypothetical protein